MLIVNSVSRVIIKRINIFLHTYIFTEKNLIQSPGEPREHRLGEVLQGSSKSKFNIILSYFVFFGGFRFP